MAMKAPNVRMLQYETKKKQKIKKMG